MSNLNFRIGFDGIDMDSVEKAWKKSEKEIQNKINKSSKLTIPVDDVAIKNLNTQLSQTEKMLNRIVSLQSKSTATKPLTAFQSGRLAQIEPRAIAQAADAQNKAAISAQRLQTAQDKANKSINEGTKAWRSQAGVLNGIPQYLNAYISALGGVRLVTKIKEITADYEKQLVALKAITKEAQFAEQLFNKIKVEAIKSPFMTKELVTYTKQLAAYNIENENLFSTMTRLADVSAGLGVDMDRLILAYGQVKAASVLRGTEIRQFTEAGIPLIELLAEKFSKLRNEVVTTGDVFDLVSERKVPFEMVKEIFEDMTSAGGKFYEMQKIQAESLWGVYANLSDNIEIAFDKIGRDNRDLLMNIGKGATILAQNLTEVVDALGVAAIGFGGLKLAQIGLNKALGDQARTILQTELASKKKLAITLAEEAAYRNLTDAELETVRTATKLTAADRLRMAQQGKLNQAMITRMYLTGKLNKDELLQIGIARQLDRATLKQLVSMTALQRGFAMARIAVAGFVVQLKAMVVALATNPYTWIAALVGVVTWLINAGSEARKLREELGAISTKGLSTLNDDIYKLKDLQKKLEGATKGSKEYSDTLTELTNRYGVYLPKLSEAVDKNKYLKDSIDGVTQALRLQAEQVALEESRTKVTEKYAEDLDKYKERIISSLNDIQGITSSMANDIANESINEVRNILERGGELTFDKVKKILKDLISQRGLSYTNKNPFLYLASYASKYASQLKDVLDAENAVFSAFRLSTDESTDDMRKYSAEITRITEKAQQDIKNIQQDMSLTPDQKEFQVNQRTIEMLNVINDTYGQKLPKSTEQYRKKLKELTEETGGLSNTINKYIDNLKGMAKWQKFAISVKPGESTTAYFERLNSLVEENTKKIQLNNGEFATKTLSSERQVELTKENKLLSDQTKTVKMILEMFGFLKTKSASGVDPRISQLKAEISLIEQAASKYKELQKVKGEVKAKEEIEKLYGGVFKEFKELKGVGIQFTPEGVRDSIRKALQIGKGYLKSTDILELRVKISDSELNQIIDNLKLKLQKAQREIEDQFEKVDLFEKLLGKGVKEDLALEITFGIGGEVPDLGSFMKDKISQTLQDMDLSFDFDMDTASMRDEINKFGDTLNQETKSMLEKYVQFVEERTKKLTISIADIITLESPGGEGITFDFSKIYVKATQELKKYRNEIAKSVSEEGRLKKLISTKEVGGEEYKALSKQLAILTNNRIKAEESVAKASSATYTQMLKDVGSLGDKFIRTAIEAKGLGDDFSRMGEASSGSIKKIIAELDTLKASLFNLAGDEGGILSTLLADADLTEFTGMFDVLKNIEGFDALKKNFELISQSIDGIADTEKRNKLKVIVELLKKYGIALENSTQSAEKARLDNFIKEVNALSSAINNVISSTQEIFETFGIGVDSITGKSLDLMKTIATSASTIIESTAKVAAAGISTAEKASAILAIVSVAIQIINAVAKIFDKSEKLERNINMIGSEVEYLVSMYSKLKTETFYDPQNLAMLQKEIGLRNEMLNQSIKDSEIRTEALSADFDQNIGQAITSAFSQGAQGGVDAMRGILKGDMKMVGKGVLNYLSLGAYGGLEAIFNYQAMKKLNELKDKSNKQLEYNNKLMAIANSNMTAMQKAGESQIANIEQQNEGLREQMRLEFEKGRKMDPNKILEYQKQIAENTIKAEFAYLEIIRQNIADIFTELSNGISDALLSAFENGENAADSFDHSIDKMMRNIIKNLFKMNVLPNLIKPFTEKFNVAMGLNPDGSRKSDGAVPDMELTLKEANELKVAAKEMKDGTISAWSQLEDVLSIFDSDLIESNLTGIAKNIAQASEDQIVGAAVAFNLVGEEMIKVNSTTFNIYTLLAKWDSEKSISSGNGVTIQGLIEMQQSYLIRLPEIADNTRETASGIASINEKLDSIIKPKGSPAIKVVKVEL